MLTMDALALLDLNLPKILDTHGSLDSKVAKRVVVLSSQPVLHKEDGGHTEIPFFCSPATTMSSAATSFSPCRASSLLDQRWSNIITESNSHGKLVDLDEDVVPHASFLEHSQSIRIHLSN
jgi:hypothetical protein